MLLVSPDGFSNKKAAYIIVGKEYVIQTDWSSAQIVELQAVNNSFSASNNDSFNLYTYSHTVFRILQVLEIVPYIGTSNNQVKMLFEQIQNAIHFKESHCALWVM